jgi:hypothetical protein
MDQWNLWAGWTGMMFGLVSGAVIGLKFHREDFAGGYASFRRRMLRIGHLAFFGLGIINVLFALTLTSSGVVLSYPALASASLAAAVFVMPVVCFLTAWKEPFRHIFPLPVILVAISLALLLEGLVMR